MNYSRILVIRPGALGDTVLTEPVVASIRAAYPGARIVVAGRTEYLPLLVGPGGADGCVSMDGREFTSLFTGGPIELADYDVVAAFLPDEDGALARRLAGRFKRAVVRDPRPPDGVHVVDHLLGALGPLGVAAARREARIECRAEWRRAADAVLAGRGGYIVIHPGSGGRGKLWQAEKWAEVIEALGPERVVLTSGPADEGVVEPIVSRTRRAGAIRVLGGQPITTVAGVLARARLYAGCDSGMTHLAAALGVPTVAIFGPTDRRAWGPRGERVAVLAGTDGSTASVTVSQVMSAL